MDEDKGQREIKLVLVGDASVGKTSLITNYLHNRFNEDYEPTVLDVYKGVKNIKKRQILIEIHDTSGDDVTGIRQGRLAVYSGADCFAICTASNSPESFEHI